ncbi:MAG: hypothetical protein RAK23_04790 [Thermoplasmata archaeon]|nr:hypothetical protein [Thermoplasmata archaeon]
MGKINISVIYQVYQLNMRKNIVIIGVILLILGVIMFGASSYKISQNIEKGSIWHQYKNNEYISEELNFSSDYALIYSYNLTNSGVIYSITLNLVNNTNLKDYVIKPTVVENNMLTYDLKPGNYYIVIFSRSSPNVTYTFIDLDKVVLTSLLELFGIILAVIGIIVAIIGLILKKKR